MTPQGRPGFSLPRPKRGQFDKQICLPCSVKSSLPLGSSSTGEVGSSLFDLVDLFDLNDLAGLAAGVSFVVDSD